MLGSNGKYIWSAFFVMEVRALCFYRETFPCLNKFLRSRKIKIIVLSAFLAIIRPVVLYLIYFEIGVEKSEQKYCSLVEEKSISTLNR